MLAIAMPTPGVLIIVGIVVVLLFGNRLPEVMRSLGRSVVEFKKGTQDITDEIKDIENVIKK